jgi:hypothetical protein
MKTQWLPIAAALLISAATANLPALAGPPNGPFYGPDSSYHLSNKNTTSLRLEPGERVILKFTSNAERENAVCIYRYSDGQRLAIRNNKYNMPFQSYSYKNNSGGTEWILVTGWHKAIWSSSVPWSRSPFYKYPKKAQSNGWSRTIGFEDHVTAPPTPNSGAYNDIVVWARVYKKPTGSTSSNNGSNSGSNGNSNNVTTVPTNGNLVGRWRTNPGDEGWQIKFVAKDGQADKYRFSYNGLLIGGSGYFWVYPSGTITGRTDGSYGPLGLAIPDGQQCQGKLQGNGSFYVDGWTLDHQNRRLNFFRK